MTSLEEVLGLLGTVSEARFRTATSQLLATAQDWSVLVANHLRSVEDSWFLREARAAQTGSIQPFTIPCLADSHLSVFVNFFDRKRFDELLEIQRITPHRHHFHFATRILTGGYSHWRFEQDPSLAGDKLKIRETLRIRANDVYSLGAEDVHWVLEPDDETTSLMIRFVAECKSPVIGQPLPDAQLLGLRDRILRVLGTSGSPCQGSIRHV